MNHGRPFGGLAILWRKNIVCKCKIIEYDDKRLLGILLQSDLFKLLILNVYLPYECQDNYVEFLQYLGKIHSIVQDIDTPNVIIAGDWNAGSNATLFGREFRKFIDEQHYIASDVELLRENSNTFTHYSEAHGTVSWIDHIITTSSSHRSIGSISINTNFISSDHFPLYFTTTF